MSDAVQALLDREIPVEYRRAATEHIAKDTSVAVRATESAVIFRVNTEWLALATTAFQGVADIGVIHSLPRRGNNIVLGITNVQGELLVCVSLAGLLGIAPGDLAEASRDATASRRARTNGRLMIVKGAGGMIAIPVHQVQGIHRYLPAHLGEVPATLTHANSRYTVGMLSWQGHAVARLDDELVFHSITKALA